MVSGIRTCWTAGAKASRAKDHTAAADDRESEPPADQVAEAVPQRYAQYEGGAPATKTIDTARLICSFGTRWAV